MDMVPFEMPPQKMTLWKLTLAYDGTPYHGWQIQPGLPTVQGVLAEAIEQVTSECVLPQGSGRTDAGVHALGQVASFPLSVPIPAANLHRALNHALPASIRVLAAEPAPSGFHARHSAIRKTYEYRIFPLKGSPDAPSFPCVGEKPVPERICPPILAPFVWPCRWPLSLETLSQTAAQILGTHDFTSFAASDPDLTTRSTHLPMTDNDCHSDPERREGKEPPRFARAADNLRTIHHSQWHAHGDLLIYTVTGSGFLHHMVRNLVGTFVQAGAHRLSPGTIPALLAARNRAAAGPTAPPSGLFLRNVTYPEAVELL